MWRCALCVVRCALCVVRCADYTDLTLTSQAPSIKIFAEIISQNAKIPPALNQRNYYFLNGAEGENRTPTMLKLITRSLVLRVYQFRHPRFCSKRLTSDYYTTELFCVKSISSQEIKNL